MKNRNALGGILGQKCPRCRQSSLFSGGAYQKGFTEMNDKCSFCDLLFKSEPGFYDGAMYVSYALQVAVFVTVLVAYLVLYPEASIWMKMGSLIMLILFLFPLIFRLSRTMWIYIFVKHDREFLKQ